MNKKEHKGKEASGIPKPLFTKQQLLNCRALEMSPDVMDAALHGDRSYTIEDAQKAIKHFIKRKV